MTDTNAVVTTFDPTALQPRKLTELLRASGVDTPAKSISSGVISVSTAVKLLSRKETAGLVVSQIVRCESMLNPARPMSPEAMAETAYMVVDSCLSAGIDINFADIDIVFRRAVSGFYGKMMGSIGSADILGWFNAYFAEKTDAYIAHNVNEANQYKYHSDRSAETARVNDLIEHKRAHAQYINDKNK